MAVTAEVIECRGSYYVKCKNCVDGAAFYVDEDFKTHYTAHNAFYDAGFVSKESASRVKDSYLNFVNTLELSM